MLEKIESYQAKETGNFVVVFKAKDGSDNKYWVEFGDFAQTFKNENDDLEKQAFDLATKALESGERNKHIFVTGDSGKNNS